ncbi:MAG TPA: lytic transglycosylase domain-containing protein [Actinomycetota bacterium]|nr:lytic transglycosylase domain-containing protein [Actinomycetota bacterium]
MRRAALLVAVLLVSATFGAAVLAGAVTGTALPGGELSGSQTSSDRAAGGPPSGRAVGSIPPTWLALYQRAAATCPGLPWTVLAGIGTVESDNGQSTAAGVRTGANFAGAEGPMQFEPPTFATNGVVGPGGADPPSPYDPVDAVYSAAHLLCSDGGGDPSMVATAIFAYNHSSDYVAQVLSLASSYGAAPGAGRG